MGPGNLSRAELQALDGVVRIARALERIADTLAQWQPPAPPQEPVQPSVADTTTEP